MATIENLTNPGQAPIQGDLVRITHNNGAVEEKTYFDSPSLAQYKLDRISLIKQEAFDRISDIDWKVTRARERLEASVGTQQDLNDVLSERETIRTNSDTAETDVNALTTVSGVLAFTW